MIIYNQISQTAYEFAKKISYKFSINLYNLTDYSDNQTNSQNIVILAINISGEEELSNEWITFLEKKRIYAKKILVFLFGVYDHQIDLNSTIIIQLKYYLERDSIHIDFYPYKLSRFNLLINDINNFIEYYLDKYSYSDTIDKLLLNLISTSKQSPIINNYEKLDLTTKSDGFSNFLNFQQENVTDNLKHIIDSMYQESFVCNRINLNKFQFENLINTHLRKVYFKSCMIKETPNLLGLINLKLVNFSANLVSDLYLSNLPKKLERINFSKNRITNININTNLHTINSISLFNNKIKSYQWLSNMIGISYLNIGLNPISVFPEEILFLEKLEYLNISMTNIKYLPKELLSICSLKTLDIKYCENLNKNSHIIQKLQEKGVKIVC